MKYLPLILIIFSLLHPKMILTEIMFNTAADENQDEFIEIYNNSDSTIDLTGWAIADNAETDLLIKYHGFTDMLLKPYSYCVIMDSSYYLNSTEYEDMIPDSVLRVMINDGSMGQYGLSNSYDETIKLFDPDSVLSDSVTYDCTTAEGYTWERSSFEDHSWSRSLVLRGTPGFKNSVMPLDTDLELYSIVKPAIIDPAGNNIFTVKVRNKGLSTISGLRINLSVNETFYNFVDYAGSLASNDSAFVDFTVFFDNSGTQELVFEAETENDSGLNNNSLTFSVFVPYIGRPFVLNEFMKNPAAGQCEYIEIYNISGEPVNIGDFGLTDEIKSSAVFFPDSLIAPESFIVMAKDTTIFTFPDVIRQNVFIASNLPALNNTYDKIFLLSKDELTADSIYYDDMDDDAGRSIEKINPEFSSNDICNWHYCVDAGTPTLPNTVYQEPEDIGNSAHFKISPRTATPNGDGENDNLLISYQFDSSYIYLTMKIYNIKGQLISKPLNGDYRSSKDTFAWNCKDDNGMIADTGAYICLLKAKDDKGKAVELKEAFYIAK
jgi:hypothetical protein